MKVGIRFLSWLDVLTMIENLMGIGESTRAGQYTSGTRSIHVWHLDC